MIKLLEKPILKYWTKMFFIASILEMIYAYFFPDKSFSTIRILLLSLLLAIVNYFGSGEYEAKKD